MKSFCFLLEAILAAAVIGSASAVSYQGPYNLEDYCGLTLALPCPTSASYRGGTLRFYNVPRTSCDVSVKLFSTSPACSSSNNTYSIYVNIKRLDIASSDELLIYDYSNSSSSPVLIKVLTGMSWQSVNPTSVGQFRTEGFLSEPRIKFSFISYTGSISPNYEIVMDYNIVKRYNEPFEKYCSALGGYVDEELMCDTSDRVNCPYSYSTTAPVYNKDLSTCIPDATTNAPTSSVCVYPSTHLTITCSKGQLSISEPDPDNLAASSVVFRGDQTRKCRNLIYELHVGALQLSGIHAKTASEEALTVICVRGSLTVTDTDPNSSEATVALFQGDNTRKCQELIYQIHAWALQATQISKSNSE